MAQKDDIKGQAGTPALFAEITTLLEDAHEIAVRGQNSKLERAEHVKAAEELIKMLRQIQSLSENILLMSR
jgi:hypothetical protein